MEENGRVFRNAMFGFHKDDVAAYIEQTAARQAEQQKQAEEEISLLRSRLDQREQEFQAADRAHADALSQKESLLEACQKELEEATKGQETLKAALGEEMQQKLSAQEQEFKQLLAEKDREIDRLRQDAERLTEEANSLRQASEEYAQIKDKLTEIELSAHLRALEVAKEAEDNACRTKAEAEEAAFQLKSEAEEAASRVKSESEERALRLKQETDLYMKTAEENLTLLLLAAEEQGRQAEETLCACKDKIFELSSAAAAVAQAIQKLRVDGQVCAEESGEQKADEAADVFGRQHIDKKDEKEETEQTKAEQGTECALENTLIAGLRACWQSSTEAAVPSENERQEANERAEEPETENILREADEAVLKEGE